MARRQVIVRRGVVGRAAEWAWRHPFWLVGLVFAAKLIEERGL
jgi:hypothetical protein